MDNDVKDASPDHGASNSPEPAWQFPKSGCPTVFLGSPGDVAYLREIAKSEFHLLQSRAPDRGVCLYRWEDEAQRRPFEQGIPYQGQIPLVADANRLCGIFLFGERIGSPLPVDFPLQRLQSSPALAPDTRHRLQLEWGDEPGDGFPLTGSTFEVLLAESVVRSVPGSASNFLVLFVGDDSLDDERSILKQRWGNHHWRQEKRRTFHQDDEDEFWEWVKTDWADQASRLRNFYRYLRNDRALPVRKVRDDAEARARIRAFLARHLRVPETSRINPFKGVAPYDVADGAFFFGRENLVRDIAGVISRSLDEPATTSQPFVCIKGASGSGKSSLLRAGVAAHLSDTVSLGNWVQCVVRPSDMVVQAGSVQDADPLAALYGRCVAELAGTDDSVATIHEAMERCADTSPHRRAAWVTRELVRLMDAPERRRQSEHKGAWRLLIGLDQFEECLQDLAVEGPSAERWGPLIEFLERALETRRVAIALTIPESRMPQLRYSQRLENLHLAGREWPVGFPTTHIGEIVDRSFSMVVPTLSSGLRARLMDEIQSLTDSAKGQDHAAILPLLSLTMTRIYERWEERIAATAAESRPGPAVRADDARKEVSEPEQVPDLAREFDRGSAPIVADLLTLDDYADQAALASVIGREAEAAMTSALSLGRNVLDEESALATLLRPMVQLRGKGEIDLRPAPPPRDPGVRAIADALRSHRLIADAGVDRLRLVHESVLRHWERAEKWMDRERKYLKYHSEVRSDIEKWVDSGRDPAKYADFGKDTIRGAPEVLYAWAETLVPIDADDPVETDYAELRDFAVGAMRWQNTPDQVIDGLESGPTQMHAAVAADALDLVDAYLAVNSSFARLARSKDGRTPLFDAAFMNRSAMLERLIGAGARADQPDHKGWLPLHAAAARGRQQAAEVLLRHCSYDVAGPSNVTALHLAGQSGSRAVLRILLDCGAQVDSRTDDQWTPLHYAANGGRAGVVRDLLAHGAAIDAFEQKQWTPLQLAIQHDHVDVVDALLEHGADPAVPEARGMTPLHLAASLDLGRIVERLLVRGADASIPNNDGWTAFHVACRRAGAAVVQLLLDHSRTDPARPVGTSSPLTLSVEAGRIDVVRVLLADARIDRQHTDSDGRTAVDIAVASGRPDILRLLIADQTVDARWLAGAMRDGLRRAVRKRDVSCTRLLLEAGATCDDMDASSPTSVPLLVLAADSGFAEIVDLLLQFQPASLGARDSHGRTALHIAAASGNLPIVERLLASGADASLPDRIGLTALGSAIAFARGDVIRRLANSQSLGAMEPVLRRTALHVAADRDRVDIVAQLIVLGADPLARDARDGTPLHAAIEAGSSQVALYLMQTAPHLAGLVDAYGWTPLHLAAHHGRSDLIEPLLSSGGDPEATSRLPVITPLQAAAELGNTAVVLKLLDAEVNPSRTTTDRPAALVCAVRNAQYATACAIFERFPDLNATDLQGASVVALYVDDWFTRDTGGGAHREEQHRFGVMLLDAGAPLPDTLASRLRRPFDQPTAHTTQTPAVPVASVASVFEGFEWEALSEQERAAVIDGIQAVDGAQPVDAGSATIDRCRLPWYDTVVLVRIQAASLLNRRLVHYFLQDGGGVLRRLDGTSPLIHELNAREPLRLDDDNAIAYLKFFCFFVRGEEGPFYVLTKENDPVLPEKLDGKLRDLIRATAHPVNALGTTADGSRLYGASILYSNALFVAHFKVHASGMVEMYDDEPIAADLPFRLDVPIS